MTDQEFEKAFQTSKERLIAYAETQPSAAQKKDAAHRLRHLEINKTYYDFNRHKMYACKKCGALEMASYVENVRAQMLEAEVCFYCNHWEQIAAMPDDRLLVINGATYRDGGRKFNTNSGFLGHSGHVFRIRKDGVEWETNNLWSGGVIPEEFRDRLPDNAEFVK